MEDKKWKVYVHENKFNGKRYVGITSKKRVQSRWDNGKGYASNCYFNSAILKYGWHDGFYHYVIAENLTEKEAKQMEMDFIETWDLMNSANGYNLTKGGDGTTGRVFSKETITKMRASAKGRVVSEATKIKLKKIRSITKYENSTPVVCITTNMEFRSISDADRFYNLNNSGSHISACCRGYRKYVGVGEDGVALQWCFKQEYDTKIITYEPIFVFGRNSKKIVCLNSMNVYKGAKHAGDELSIDSSSITKCCKGKKKHTKGLKWMYYSEYVKISNKELFEW